jgi:transcriptional regulator with XRE-family HTH domain
MADWPVGFCPIDPDDTPGRRLARARQCLGLGQKRLAQMVGIDPNTIWRLEKETWEGRETFLKKLLRFIEDEADRRALAMRCLPSHRTPP